MREYVKNQTRKSKLAVIKVTSVGIAQDLLYTLLSVKHELLSPLSLTTIIHGSTRIQQFISGVVYDVPIYGSEGQRVRSLYLFPHRQVEAIEMTVRLCID
uniref:DNA helicase n=1 Tax=Brugia pahangi TaxID=6280 RepID=A0A0N4TMP0_BRUPA